MQAFNYQLNDKEEEEKIVRLFLKVTDKNKGEFTEKDIADAVIYVIENFQRGISGACNSEIINNRKILLGFFYRFSSLYAGITRTKFLKALRGCEKLRSCFHRRSLKMVDVGSGAGSAWVGLFSALVSFEENAEGKNVKGFPFEYLEVIALDYIRGWEGYFTDTVEFLGQDDECVFGNASRLFREKQIRCSFLLQDVLDFEELKEMKQLKEADIILLKGFLSILNHDNDRYRASQAIASAMKLGSLLVIIESPTYEQYFQEPNLRLVFTTRKYLPENSSHNTSFNSDDGSPIPLSVENESEADVSISQGASSESDDVWEDYNSDKKPNIRDKYKMVANTNLFVEYGRGLALTSTQQIFVLEKVL